MSTMSKTPLSDRTSSRLTDNDRTEHVMGLDVQWHSAQAMSHHWRCDLSSCAVLDCEDHLHSVDYHSADCWCGRTEADCLAE